MFGARDLTLCGRARPGLDRRRPVLRLGADRQVLRVKAAEPAAPTRMRWIEPHNNAASYWHEADNVTAGAGPTPNADTAPDEEHTAPSHDGVERLAGFIFQPLGLRYSVVGGRRTECRAATYRLSPVPPSSLLARVVTLILVNEQRDSWVRAAIGADLV